jgi:hypothetical protein
MNSEEVSAHYLSYYLERWRLIMKKLTPVFLLVFLLAMPVWAEYFTLEGPNFYVHFPKGYENLAAKLATQAEEILPYLGKEMSASINGKAHLVIEDRIDVSNGYTRNFPYPHISFFPVFPDDVLMGGLGPNVSDWFEMLLMHEGTHLYHMEMQDNFSYAFTLLFGRSLANYPQVFSPIANLEGLAVLNETKYQTFGRGSDAIYTMILDAAIDADDLPNPRLILGSYDTNQFDLAGIYYLYGWSFMEFLANKYGPEAPLSLQKLYLDNKLNIFLSRFDSALVKLTGKRYVSLAKEWYAWLKENYDQPELTPEGKIHKNSGDDIYPGFFSGEYFYYAQSGKSVSPGLYRLNLETEEEEMLAFVPNILGSIRQDRLGKIYFSKLDPDASGNGFSNIYIYNKGQIKPFITGERAYSPYPVSLDTIYYLRHMEGQGNALYKKVADNEPELIYQAKPGEEILQFTVGSTGVVFASMWREGGFTDLARIRDGEVYYFTSDRYSDTYPILSNDETTIYFQSNRGGRYGIWVYDIISNNVAPVVNNHYGAFKPVINRDNTSETELAFVSYTHAGLRVGTYTWDLNADWDWAEEEEIPEPKVYPTLEDLLEKGYKLKRYAGLNWVKPIEWAPTYIGVMFGGADPLMNYYYTLSYSYNAYDVLEMPRHNLNASLGYNINPLHSITTSFSSNLVADSNNLSLSYNGTVPISKNQLELSTSFNNQYEISSSIALRMPWANKKLKGTNYVFGSANYSYFKEDLELNYGTGLTMAINRNLRWNLELSALYNSIGYQSTGSKDLGQNLLVFNTKLSYVFARPFWSLGASGTMWSEKMTIAPVINLILGDSDWDAGLGTELRNTTTLIYGRLPISYGVRAMYYPRVNKVIFSPVISF